MNQKRSIFEEVDSDKRVEPTISSPKDTGSARGKIAIWLGVIIALLVAGLVVGTISRGAGASNVVDWDPVISMIPPSGNAAWNDNFDYFKSNMPEPPEITLDEYKSSYWASWTIDILAKLTGIIWLGGFFWFFIRKQIPPGWSKRLLGVGGMLAVIAAVGIIISAQGISRPSAEVISYHLALVHGIVFVIIAAIFWFVFELRREAADLLQARRRRDGALMRMTTIFMALMVLALVQGAALSGVNISERAADWPLMAGGFMPEGGFSFAPFWANFFENPAMVEFAHRLLTYLVVLFGVFIWWRSRKSASASIRSQFNVLMIAIILAAVLGVMNVLYAAPLHFAILHLLAAVLLVAIAMRARFEAAYPAEQKISRG